ncbi:MAG: hypothetical protein COV45_08670 [Deltaproteobacteria bacterium CG11_big_fil_rev_8_21_14_0_20_47_16]|nr:MAG: hypothetical protein COV45_08670 [Deltaproteobacteria bacterium CG11_big_fil_rev_8_21_14_0_20_47_16]
MWRKAMIERGFGHRGQVVSDLVLVNGVVDAFIPKTHQVHGALVKHVTAEMGDLVMEADAFVATDPKVVCSVMTADCVPLLMWDTQARIVAAVHAGWRGVAANIATATVDFIRDMVPNADLRVAMGPAMGSSCYEVGDEVVSACAKTISDISPFIKATSQGHQLIDLKGILFEQLGHVGVMPNCIESDLTCTHCNTTYASYRRGDRRERQHSWIVIS